MGKRKKPAQHDQQVFCAMNTENSSENTAASNPDSPQTTPPSSQQIGESEEGDVVIQQDLHGDSQGVTLVALAREGESRAACWERLRKEARAAGMPRGQGIGTAYGWATAQVERLFAAPIEPEPDLSTKVDIAAAIEADPPLSTKVDIDQGVSGLGDLPTGWGQLPANAQLQHEIAWVSANRLRVRSGAGVDLSRALSPAPSYAALSWLETSILFPSKFADISVKATAGQEDEAQHVRREKLAIEEIRAILAEMLEE